MNLKQDDEQQTNTEQLPVELRLVAFIITKRFVPTPQQLTDPTRHNSLTR